MLITELLIRLDSGSQDMGLSSSEEDMLFHSSASEQQELEQGDLLPDYISLSSMSDDHHSLADAFLDGMMSEDESEEEDGESSTTSIVVSTEESWSRKTTSLNSTESRISTHITTTSEKDDNTSDDSRFASPVHHDVAANDPSCACLDIHAVQDKKSKSYKSSSSSSKCFSKSSSVRNNAPSKPHRKRQKAVLGLGLDTTKDKDMAKSFFYLSKRSMTTSRSHQKNSLASSTISTAKVNIDNNKSVTFGETTLL